MRVITPATVITRRHRWEILSTMAPRPALGPILTRRQVRHVEWERRRTTPRRLTPSSLAEGKRKAGPPHTVIERDAELGRMVGICAHAVLERWDFAQPRTEIYPVIEQACRRYLAQDHPQLIASVTEDLTPVFEQFLSSEPYKRLQRATILGREVPFAMPLGDGQMIEGVIDLIYRLDGRIWIADYKTDDVSTEAARARADHYRSQSEMYSRAVASALALPSLSFQFIFVRPGVAIEI